MQLNKQLVNEFQKFHSKKYGLIISYNVAESQLKELAALVRLTSKKEVQL